MLSPAQTIGLTEGFLDRDGTRPHYEVGSANYQYDVTGLSTITSGGITTHVVRTPDGQLLSERVVNGSNAANSCYLTDGLGSVTDVTDMKGNVENQYQYDPYGNIQGVAEETVTNPFRYIGAVWDSQTNLYKLGARYYSSTTSRFTQPDPAACSHTRNVYSYAGDSPITYSDPDGQRIRRAAQGAGGALRCLSLLTGDLAEAFPYCSSCALSTAAAATAAAIAAHAGHIQVSVSDDTGMNCAICKELLGPKYQDFMDCIDLALNGLRAGGGSADPSGDDAVAEEGAIEGLSGGGGTIENRDD